MLKYLLGLQQREELRRLLDRMGQHGLACRCEPGTAATRISTGRHRYQLVIANQSTMTFSRTRQRAAIVTDRSAPTHTRCTRETRHIVAEFADLDPRERLELLWSSPRICRRLPERYQAERDAGLHRIVECQTPTFIWVELVDGRVQIHADCAPEAPTVKGFVGILVDAFSGQRPKPCSPLRPDFYCTIGPVWNRLGMVRMRGLAAIQHHIREQVRQAAAAS